MQVGSAARSFAATVEAAADDVRELARQAQAAGTTGWRSASAEAFRQRLAEEVAAVLLSAVLLDDAAAAIRAHAAAVDGVLDPVAHVFGLGS